MVLRYFIFSITLIFCGCATYKTSEIKSDIEKKYLNSVKKELTSKWPNNKIINLVFHGHSVPSGYFVTPTVETLASYPHLVLKQIKAKYPFAVVNCIITSKGGENSIQGMLRFKDEVLNHKPDVVFLDYGLNDRKIRIEEAKKAWEAMITEAKIRNIPIILLSTSPDMKVDYTDANNLLKQHSEQVQSIAKNYQVGFVDVYKSFEFLYPNKKELNKYMSQFNHPNKKGHELIANEIIKYF